MEFRVVCNKKPIQDKKVIANLGKKFAKRIILLANFLIWHEYPEKRVPHFC